MATAIVPFDGSEAAYRDRVALLKDAQPDEPWSVEGERASDAADAALGRPGGAFFAQVDGARLGFARFRAEPGEPAGRRHRLWLVVAHAARRRGLGSALLQAAGTAAAACGAREFLVSTSLAEPEGAAFARSRGFVEVGAEVELHLDLARRPAAACSGGAAGAGWRVGSLAGLAQGEPAWQERYYALYAQLAAEVASPGSEVPGPEGFRAEHLSAPEFLSEGTTVAVLGGEWVGLCELWRSGGDRHTAYQELTGVLAAHRRRGIGTALVAAAADWAQRQGYRRLFTSTGATNRGMQGLARRLGYVPGSRWSYLVGAVPGGGVLSGREVGS